ncbi:hypothetical protein [Marinobacterium weihaiense]|uniref:Uncharacterized protein n=1 Tax=Marinobacterium weihaiense TaxID=2851016 RepID=A0ABS6M958_9GAMM|nr:hypothetical protein [Marinobacterium weihaiense]MBV0932814.1 hypothetical protein [Marinobacterium weihaiense]
MFKTDRTKLFPTAYHPAGRAVLPWYERVGRKVFRSYGHPDGPSTEAEFIVQQDKLIPLAQSADTLTGAPWFVERDQGYCPGYGHPDGSGRLPWFESRD